MKKIIYISGIACANLMMFGCIFKVQHWPGAGILLSLSVFLFCFYFLPFALISSYQSQEQKKFTWLYLVTFIVFFIGMMGTLFKIQHWPGGGILLFIGIPLPFILFLPVYLYQTRNEKKNETLNFLGIMFGLTFLAVFSVLLALNVSRKVMENVVSNIENNDGSALFNQSKVKKFSSDNGIKQRSDELCAYIDVLKCELLTATQNKVCENNGPKPGYLSSQIINGDNTNIPMNILYSDEPNTRMNNLKIKINTYRESLLASGKTNPELTELTNALFSVGTANHNEAMLSWEQREFSSYQLIIVLDVLSQIQSNVRLVESEFLAIK
jgi:hypothetical protein